MTPADLLSFRKGETGEEFAIEPDAIEIEPDLEIEPEPVIPPTTALAPVGLMEVLPADFKLPELIKFIPNPALRAAADQAAAYALGVKVDGAEGIERADVALTALRSSVKAIGEHLEEPIAIANGLHKRLTGVRSEWCAQGEAAIKTVGGRIFTEQRRLETIAAEERRKAQAEADRVVREAARKEADAAVKADAPTPVVNELIRQAETITAPPVAAPTPAPVLRGSTTVTTWKARIVGAPACEEPNPAI
jgi:hypothetical protein